jgi:hypothetical protein
MSADEEEFVTRAEMEAQLVATARSQRDIDALLALLAQHNIPPPPLESR